MNEPAPSKLRRTASILMWAALGVAVLAYPAAMAVDAAQGRDVILLQSAFDDSTVETNRSSSDDTLADAAERRAAIVAIYGSNAAKAPAPERVLFVDPAEVIVPKEDASLALLRPAKADGYHYQAKSLLFVAKMTAFGAAAAFVVIALVRKFLIRT